MAQDTSLFEKFKETGKHGIIYGVGSILEKALAFLLLPLYTTRFAASDYGILGLVTTTGTVLSIIFTIGMNVGLLRSYYDYDDEESRKKVVSTSFYIVLISSIIMLILGISFSRYLSFLLFKSADYNLHFIIIVITSVFNILNIIPLIIFRIKKKSVHFIIFQTSFLAIGIGIIIYLVNYRHMGILGSLIGNLAMSVIGCITLYIYFRREIVFKFLKVEGKKMLLLGLPLIPSDLSVFVFTAIDRYFLNYYSTTKELGLYNLAYNFGNMMTVLIATPISLIWPVMYLSVKDHDNAKEFYSRTLTYTLTVSFFLFLILSLLSKEVLQIMSNKEYWGANAVIPLIVLTYSLWSIRKIINVASTLKRKMLGLAIVNFGGAAVNIGLNFLLIPRYGILGAGYSTLITYILVIIALIIYNQSLMKINYEWFRLLKLAVVTAAIFAAGYFIKIDRLSLSILYKIAIILLFPLLLYVIRFFTKNEIQRAKNACIKFSFKIKTKKK